MSCNRLKETGNMIKKRDISAQSVIKISYKREITQFSQMFRQLKWSEIAKNTEDFSIKHNEIWHKKTCTSQQTTSQQLKNSALDNI